MLSPVAEERHFRGVPEGHGAARSYSLTASEIESFERDGVVGPFPAFLDEASLNLLGELVSGIVRRRPRHPLYGDYPDGRFSVRDWHLACPEIHDLLTHPAVTGRVQSLAGESMLLWRSKIFYKKPGAGELAWHQEWGYFNGEEIGNDRPSLVPRGDGASNWSWTVWFALQDMTPALGPVRFFKGSHQRRYPWERVPMVQSAFFESFLDRLTDVEEIVRAAKSNNLFLDVDTSRLFADTTPVNLDLAEARRRIASFLGYQRAKLTLPFAHTDEDIVTFDSMKRGEFIIFTERCMHGSTANTTSSPRLAINARITRRSTLVYPQRLLGQTLDGSNLDIREHRCIALGGQDECGLNAYGQRPRACIPVSA